MKVSYEEDLANHFGLQRRVESGNRFVLSNRAKEKAGQVWSSEITTSVCRSCPDSEKATSQLPFWQGSRGHGGVLDPVHAWTSQSREPGGPVGSHPHACAKVQGHRWDGQKTSPTESLIRTLTGTAGDNHKVKPVMLIDFGFIGKKTDFGRARR